MGSDHESVYVCIVLESDWMCVCVPSSPLGRCAGRQASTVKTIHKNTPDGSGRGHRVGIRPIFLDGGDAVGLYVGARVAG